MNIRFKFFRIGVCRKAMQVGNHEEAGVFFLHTYVIADGSEIISEVQEPCAPDATHNDLFFSAFFHKRAKIQNDKRETTNEKQVWALLVSRLSIPDSRFSLTSPLMQLTFSLENNDTNSKARAGKITTDHGEILTPIFMPVGTAGSVKAVSQEQLKNDVTGLFLMKI